MDATTDLPDSSVTEELSNLTLKQTINEQANKWMNEKQNHWMNEQTEWFNYRSTI